MGNRASTSAANRELSALQRKAQSEAALVSGPLPASASPTAASSSPLRNFTLEELFEFNGADPNKPVYVSLLSDVYDVSADFIEYKPPGGLFHVLAGRDASRAVALMSLVDDEATSTELADLSAIHLASLDAWVSKFKEEKQYPQVGRLLLFRDFTRAELRPFNGVDNVRHTVLVGLNLNVYDVTLLGWEHYGPEGGYAQFAGRDASKALAKMSFLDEDLDDPSLDELTPEQRVALANWAARFDQKYPVVGKLLG